MSSSSHIPGFHGMSPARAETSIDSPWMAARLWLAILAIAAVWAYQGLRSTMHAGTLGAVPPDLDGVARPARFQARTVPPGASFVISEPVVMLQGAAVQQIVSVNGEYSVNGRPFTAAAGMVWPGSVIRMRARVAPGDCVTQARLVIGARSTVFRVEAARSPGGPSCRSTGE